MCYRQGYCFSVEGLNHRLIEITGRTLDVVFSRFMWVSLTITLRQKPKGVTRSRRGNKQTIEPVLRRLPVTHLGFCLRVILNETHINLENTTSCVLSVILINLWFHVIRIRKHLKTNQIFKSSIKYCRKKIASVSEFKKALNDWFTTVLFSPWIMCSISFILVLSL